MASHSRPSVPSTSPTSWRCAPAPCQSPVPYNSHVVTTCSTSTSLSPISTSTMEEIMTPSDLQRLDAQLDRLYLSHVKNHYQDLADKAAQRQLAHVEYLAQLIEGEATVRENRAIERRIRQARGLAHGSRFARLETRSRARQQRRREAQAERFLLVALDDLEPSRLCN